MGSKASAPKRKKADQRDGKVIRVSSEAYEQLNYKARGAKKNSMDSVLRRLLGLRPKNDPRGARAREFWLLPKAGLSFLRKAEARGEAILQAVRRGDPKPEAPVKVREVL